MIPFVDLRAQYESIREAIEPAVLTALASGQYVLGPEVAEFERLFAAYTSSAHAIAVNTGTSALHLALLAAGIGPGDEVLTTPLTFVATAAAIDYCGAKPVFVDVDPATLTMDPAGIAAGITARTRALVPVHLHGLPADMDPICELASEHGLTVVEDAAQAHGAEYRGHRVGSIGQLGCFSFYPGKNLGAYGEGGAVTTGDADLARTVSLLRDWGATQPYLHELKGFNYRMDGVQGAVLRVKMAHIERWTEARRSRARRYGELLAPLGFRTPVEPTDRRHVFHVYAIRHPRRDDLQAFLEERGVATRIHYPIPVHLQPAFRELGHRPGDFPHAEAAADELLSLPMYPEMTDAQQDHVVETLADWAAKEGAR